MKECVTSTNGFHIFNKKKAEMSSFFMFKRGRKAMEIINKRVDGMLTEMEKEYKEAVEAHKPLQDELNKKVEELMKEFDEKEETKRFEKIKAKADYIVLTINMPLKDETKEKVIEELVKGEE